MRTSTSFLLGALFGIVVGVAGVFTYTRVRHSQTLLLPPSLSARNHWDDLLDLTERRLKIVGPDENIADFLSIAGEQAWDRREELFTLSQRYLDDRDPAKVSGALDILYHLRGFHPMHWLGGPTFEEKYADFFARLDRAILDRFPHFKLIGKDEVYRHLSCYLGASGSDEARRQLIQIAQATADNGQTLICLAWHGNPKDMDFLLPFMLADSPSARSLPYHFRNSYGSAAMPYLQRAASEAKSEAARNEAQKEIKQLEQSPPSR